MSKTNGMKQKPDWVLFSLNYYWTFPAVAHDTLFMVLHA